MNAAFPAGKFGVIYTDAPWFLRTWSSKGRDRCPDARHYPVMTLADLKALPVANIAARDSALFLWVIDTHLEQALELGRAWGFAYKTVGFVWAQNNLDRKLGLQPWLLDPEGRRAVPHVHQGQASAALGNRYGKLIVPARRQHSRKPDEAYGAIEALLPDPCVELFARHQRPGWVVRGDQAPGDQAPKENPASGEARAGCRDL